MKNLIVSLVMLMTVAAHAESEIVYLPKGGQSAFKAGYDMGRNSNFKMANGAEITTGGSVFNLDYIYGIDNEMSVGAALSTGSETAEVKGIGKTTYSGMSDLTLKMRMGMGMWVYGADLGLPMTNKIKDGDTGNRATGGIGVTPMGGFIMSNGAFNFGGIASYAYLMDRKQEDQSSTPSVTTTVSGGSTLTLTPFAEWNFGAGLLSAEFSLRSIADTTSKVGSAASTTAKSTGVNTLKLGGTYNFTEAITGVANYTMDMVAANSNVGTPAFTASTINLGARFVF